MTFGLKQQVRIRDPESKCKALFMRGLLFESGRKVNPCLMKQGNQQMLTVNAIKWIEDARKLANNSCIESNRNLYSYLIEDLRIEPTIEMKYPNFWWDCIWDNINHSFLSTETRSILYLTFKDAISNKVKMFNYTNRVDGYNCEICRKPDTNMHRIKECDNSKIIWSWTTNIVVRLLVKNLKSPEEILYNGITLRSFFTRVVFLL